MGEQGKDESEAEEIRRLEDGEHAVLTGSEATTAAVRLAPREGPRCCWAGGAEFAVDDQRGAMVGDVLAAWPDVLPEAAIAAVDRMLESTRRLDSAIESLDVGVIADAIAESIGVEVSK